MEKGRNGRMNLILIRFDEDQYTPINQRIFEQFYSKKVHIRWVHFIIEVSLRDQ